MGERNPALQFGFYRHVFAINPHIADAKEIETQFQLGYEQLLASVTSMKTPEHPLNYQFTEKLTEKQIEVINLANGFTQQFKFKPPPMPILDNKPEAKSAWQAAYDYCCERGRTFRHKILAFRDNLQQQFWPKLETKDPPRKLSSPALMASTSIPTLPIPQSSPITTSMQTATESQSSLTQAQTKAPISTSINDNKNISTHGGQLVEYIPYSKEAAEQLLTMAYEGLMNDLRKQLGLMEQTEIEDLQRRFIQFCDHCHNYFIKTEEFARPNLVKKMTIWQIELLERGHEFLLWDFLQKPTIYPKRLSFLVYDRSNSPCISLSSSS